MDEKPKVCIYARVSTEEQNPKNELDDCVRFCKSRGWDYEYFEERGRSAFKNVKRPIRDSIIEMARKGTIQHIVVWSIDRWTRKGGVELLHELDMLISYGCQLHSVKEKFIEEISIPGEIGVHVRNFITGIVGWMAMQESKHKSDRVKASLKFKKAVHDGTIGRKNKKVNVKKIIKLREKHPDWGYGRIAQELGLSKSMVYRRFKNMGEKK